MMITFKTGFPVHLSMLRIFGVLYPFQYRIPFHSNRNAVITVSEGNLPQFLHCLCFINFSGLGPTNLPCWATSRKWGVREHMCWHLLFKNNSYSALPYLPAACSNSFGRISANLFPSANRHTQEGTWAQVCLICPSWSQRQACCSLSETK